MFALCQSRRASVVALFAAVLLTSAVHAQTFDTARPQLAPAAFQWGLPGDIPVPADYDGDGTTDLGIFRPSNGTWYLLVKDYAGVTRAVVVQWGLMGDVPLPGDYDGDGNIDLAVFRPSNGTWYVRYSNADGLRAPGPRGNR